MLLGRFWVLLGASGGLLDCFWVLSVLLWVAFGSLRVLFPFSLLLLAISFLLAIFGPTLPNLC